MVSVTFEWRGAIKREASLNRLTFSFSLHCWYVNSWLNERYAREKGERVVFSDQFLLLDEMQFSDNQFFFVRSWRRRFDSCSFSSTINFHELRILIRIYLYYVQFPWKMIFHINFYSHTLFKILKKTSKQIDWQAIIRFNAFCVKRNRQYLSIQKFPPTLIK